MLSFKEKMDVLDSFPQLQRKHVSLGRVNYHFEESLHEKKNVVYHLHPNGNGYVFAGLLHGYDTDRKGFVNIRDFRSEELRTLVADSIRSLSEGGHEGSDQGHRIREERWSNGKGQTLIAKFEDDMWYIFAGLNLEMAFETYEETKEYLLEEGFTRS